MGRRFKSDFRLHFRLRKFNKLAEFFIPSICNFFENPEYSKTADKLPESARFGPEKMRKNKKQTLGPFYTVILFYGPFCNLAWEDRPLVRQDKILKWRYRRSFYPKIIHRKHSWSKYEQLTILQMKTTYLFEVFKRRNPYPPFPGIAAPLTIFKYAHSSALTARRNGHGNIPVHRMS